jgi:hypothetical protein
MLMRESGLIALLIVASIGTSRASDGWVVREDGVGPVKIGVGLSQLNTVLREKFSMPDNKEDQGCFYVKPAAYTHVTFMIENGRLARIDVDGTGAATEDGIQVGDLEARVRRAYGARLKIEPHAYTAPQGHYLTIRSDNGRYGIRFETEKGKIETFYAGLFDAIQYVEGCQ